MEMSEEAPALGVVSWDSGRHCQRLFCVRGQLWPFEPRWGCRLGGVSHAPLTAGRALLSCLFPPFSTPCSREVTRHSWWTAETLAWPEQKARAGTGAC